MSLEATFEKYQSDLDDISNWCDNTYNAQFAPYFTEIDHLYDRFNSKYKPLSDSELEEILTVIPLNLFGVADILSKFKAQREVVVLTIKKTKYEATKRSEGSTLAAKKEEAANSVIDDEILLKAFDTLIERVEREMSYSRELIMSAKKLWTARKETETLAIGAETVNIHKSISPSIDLPEYGKEFI